MRRAALRLFARNGYAGTSIRAIAREVGLSESVLYAHFASKQAIFDAVLAEFGPSGPPAPANPTEADADPPRYLRELVHAFLDEWDTPDARLLISLLARDGLLHTPALREAVEAMRTSVAGLLERWIATGRLPPDRGSARDLALAFTAPIGLTRILYLHAGATGEERATARADILRHVETFARTFR
ncbi:TetR family transcriptional regulator [Actinophytocola xanthii]|uniref:TetR family transcriptional regulator n=1 Tax=Actinophytocola xanthii TaxID=1912961 RepID=A0A1Q8CM24_9PSEU|nr:TetR family transcriptional regulator [Actinophytocola xanthii]